MNQDNYCSLEVAQRLVDAGIVLETDFYWVNNIFRSNFTVLPSDWKILPVQNENFQGETIPAPCFAELWKELSLGSICVKHKVTGVTSCWSPDSSYIENTNPADALAELLIWVKGQVKK